MKKIPQEAVADFLEQMSFLSSVGYPDYEAVRLLYEQSGAKKDKSLVGVRKACDLLLDDLKQGYPLSTAMAGCVDYFGNLHAQIRAGEQAGKVSEVLARLSKQLRYSEKTKRRIQEAMLTPAVTLVLTLLVTWYLFHYALPSIFQVMEDSGALHLPPSTLMVMRIIDFLNVYQGWILLLATLVIVSIVYLAHGPLKVMAHKFYSHVPILGRITIDSNLTYYYSSLYYMLLADATLHDAMEIAANSVDNLHIKKQLERAGELQAQGYAIYEALCCVDVITSLERKTMEVGFKSDQNQTVLVRLAERRKTSLDSGLRKAIDLIEPTTTIVLGVIFGLVSLAVYTPLMNMGTMMN